MKDTENIRSSEPNTHKKKLTNGIIQIANYQPRFALEIVKMSTHKRTLIDQSWTLKHKNRKLEAEIETFSIVRRIRRIIDEPYEVAIYNNIIVLCCFLFFFFYLCCLFVLLGFALLYESLRFLFFVDKYQVIFVHNETQFQMKVHLGRWKYSNRGNSM